jgi:plasmid stabilization system protein ParE
LSRRLAIRVIRSAAREITEASEWWRKNRPYASDAIRDELERTFDLISSHPNVGARAINASLKGVRRVHLVRISYYLYYRATSSAVEVLAFWHTKPGSQPKL